MRLRNLARTLIALSLFASAGFFGLWLSRPQNRHYLIPAGFAVLEGPFTGLLQSSEWMVTTEANVRLGIFLICFGAVGLCLWRRGVATFVLGLLIWVAAGFLHGITTWA
jgi:hypothetical protein